MVIGSHCIDPRRVITAQYQLVTKASYLFKIVYLVGDEAIELPQFGTLSECKRWLKELDTVIGKSMLLDAISTKELEEEVDDDEECKNRIGFHADDQ